MAIKKSDFLNSIKKRQYAQMTPYQGPQSRPARPGKPLPKKGKLVPRSKSKGSRTRRKNVFPLRDGTYLDLDYILPKKGPSKPTKKILPYKRPKPKTPPTKRKMIDPPLGPKNIKSYYKNAFKPAVKGVVSGTEIISRVPHEI